MEDDKQKDPSGLRASKDPGWIEYFRLMDLANAGSQEPEVRFFRQCMKETVQDLTGHIFRERE